MARAKKIRPCVMKGRYLGTRSPGRKYKGKKGVVVPRCCECAGAGVSFVSGSGHLTPSLRYALNLDPKTAKLAQTLTDPDCTNPATGKPRPHLPVLPCAESFLHRDSPGTKAYLGIFKNSPFPGCYAVEEILLNGDEVISDLRESTGSKHDVSEEFRILDHADEVKEGLWRNAISALGGSKTTQETLDSLMELESRFDGLLGYGADPSLRSWVTDDYETLSIAEEVRAYFDNETENKVRLFLERLTKPQQDAVNALYLKNPEDLPQATVAKNLGISLASLKDRLKLVKKKAAEYFKEYAHLVNEDGTKRKRAKPGKKGPTLAAPIRHTRADGTVEIVTPTAKNSSPFGPPRPKAGVDREKIRAWLNEESGITIVPFASSTAPKSGSESAPTAK